MSDFSINDSMGEIYLYETNGLLEQLDEILLKAEKNNHFTAEDINTIFRVMHTIKGSSAMMGFDKIARVAHILEDLFSNIRSNGIDSSHYEALFNLVFQAGDFLREEVAKVESGQTLSDDVSDLEGKVELLLAKLKGNVVNDQPVVPEDSNDHPIQTPDVVVPTKTSISIYFEDDCQMENIRAMLLLEQIKEICPSLTHVPEQLVGNDEAAQIIVGNGLTIFLEDSDQVEAVSALLNEALHIKLYTINEYQPAANQQLRIRVYFEDDCQMENMRAYMLLQQLQDVTSQISYWPDDLESNEEAAQQIVHDGFVIEVKDSLKLQAVKNVIEHALHIKSYEIENQNDQNSDEVRLQEINEMLKNEKQDKADQTNEAAAPVVKADESDEHVNTANKAIKQSLISVNLNKLDVLMDIVGEVVITQSMVTASTDFIGDASMENFTKATRQLRKLTDELQDAVMAIRMVPVSGVFQKMNRVIRDMNKKLEKDVELVLIGEETEVDKTIVDGIADPLMHLVRNSMDHGIEIPSDRKASGKTEPAKVILSAENTGGEIVIKVQDNGKGLDGEQLLEKAKKRGLLTKSESEYSEREIYGLLMLPGFSTKDQVTEFSGRGVGMDVVRKNIENVGGTVHIESKKGEGMSTIFKIPLTLAIIDGMKIAVGEQVFMLPISVIRQSFKVKEESIINDIEGNQLVMIRDKCYPIIQLYKDYNIATTTEKIEDGILILVESNGHEFCLFVDELLGQNQVVVKPMPSYLSAYNVRNNGISGCTILGDGSISLILEVSSFLEQLK